MLVRNVAPNITTEDLQVAFGRIGEVRDVYIPRDYFSQQPKGFAFIEYATPSMAQEARAEMDRFSIKGRELEVVFAQERRKTPNEMRGRGGGGGGPNHHNSSSNNNNGGGGRYNDRQGGPGDFERSSSFERHRQRQRDEERGRRGSRDDGDRKEDGGGDKSSGDSRPTANGDDKNKGYDSD